MNGEKYLIRLVAWLSAAALIGILLGSAFGYLALPRYLQREESPLSQIYYRGMFDGCWFILYDETTRPNPQDICLKFVRSMIQGDAWTQIGPGRDDGR